VFSGSSDAIAGNEEIKTVYLGVARDGGAR
jgi:hypothetical protein